MFDMKLFQYCAFQGIKRKREQILKRHPQLIIIVLNKI